MTYKEQLDAAVLYAYNLIRDGMSVDDAITTTANKFNLCFDCITFAMLVKLIMRKDVII